MNLPTLDLYFGTKRMRELLGVEPPRSPPDVRLLSAQYIIDVVDGNRGGLPFRQHLEASNLKQDKKAYVSQELLKQCLAEVEWVAKVFPKKATYPGVLVISYW